MAEQTDLISTLSREDDLMEAVLLFLGVTSLINIELSSKVFRNYMKKKLTWKKKLKQICPQYFSNELPDCVKEKLSQFTALPDSHEKFKKILLGLNTLQENRKSKLYKLTKVKLESHQNQTYIDYPAMDSKCVLLPAFHKHKAWITDDLDHHSRDCDLTHQVTTPEGSKDCFCHDESISYYNRLVAITADYIFHWKLQKLMAFQKSNFQFLRSWNLTMTVDEALFYPERLNVTEKYIQFLFSHHFKMFIEVYKKKKIEDDLGPRIIRCSIGEEILFQSFKFHRETFIEDSAFDDTRLIAYVHNPFVHIPSVCVWDFLRTSPEREMEALLIWSKGLNENIFPRPNCTSLALKFPLAYIGKSNGKCEIWNIEEEVLLNVLYLGETRDGKSMGVNQIFLAGDWILTVSSVGWLCVFDKKSSEEVTRSCIEPLWRKTNSGSGRRYVKVHSDETRIVSLQVKHKEMYIVVQDFWCEVEEEKEERRNKKRGFDAYLGEGCSTWTGESNKNIKRKSTPQNIPVIQIDDEFEDNFDDIDDYDYAEPEEYQY